MKSGWVLYKFEMRQNFKSFLIWFIAIATVMVLFMLMFPSFKSSDYLELINAKINAIPKGLGTAFGLSESTVGTNFQNVFFWFSYMFQFFVIAIIIYAINLGSNIISKEHEDKHIDYLATKPIRKSYIIIAKYKVLVSYILLFSLALFIVGYISVYVFNADQLSYWSEMLRLYIKLFLEYLLFGTLAFTLAAISKRSSKSTLIVVSIFFATYLAGIAAELLPRLEKLKYLSPYFMFQTETAGIGYSKTDWWYMVALLGLTGIMLVLAVWRYSNKDLSLN